MWKEADKADSPSRVFSLLLRPVRSAIFSRLLSDRDSNFIQSTASANRKSLISSSVNSSPRRTRTSFDVSCIHRMASPAFEIDTQSILYFIEILIYLSGAFFVSFFVD
ncbi:hypothetical protein BDW74DRAFT_136337 [Aspergillus multicolor]|uniref:uncharacterized protein n=1 Tax=Aspergillus multicolor TaxID=41759 RepID=UPI003CCD8623